MKEIVAGRLIDPSDFCAPSLAAPRLPRQGFIDVVNRVRLDAKFIWPPARAYYKLRMRRYERKKTPELGLVRFLADPRRAAIDVGANLGLFCGMLAPRATEVFAIEPNPYPLRYLARVVDSNVHVLFAAACDRTGPVRLSVPRGARGWSSNGAHLMDRRAASGAVIDVPGIRLDDLALPPVGFVKIDVEGGEMAVLRGAEALLARDRPTLFLENELHHAGEDARDVFAFLKARDYHGYCLTPSGLRHVGLLRDPLDQQGLQHGDEGYVKNFVFLPH